MESCPLHGAVHDCRAWCLRRPPVADRSLWAYRSGPARGGLADVKAHAALCALAFLERPCAPVEPRQIRARRVRSTVVRPGRMSAHAEFSVARAF